MKMADRIGQAGNLFGGRASLHLDERSNNFRAIRFLAACGVIFSHAFVVNHGLSESTSGMEPLYALTGVSVGELAVNIFFVASGFLVARSLLEGRGVFDFLVARILRIYPGLIVAVLVCAFILGPISTNLDVWEYFSRKATYAFVIYDGLALSPLSIRFGLPGVFEGNPYPGVVNGSLWTLPWEIWMYISLLVAYNIRLLGRIFPLFLTVVFVTYVVSEFAVSDSIEPLRSMLRFLAFFYTGVAIRRYQKFIPISGSLALIFTACFLFGSILLQNRSLAPIYVGYMTVFLAYWPPIVVKRWADGADISYGLYIYAYPVQQVWVWLIGPHNIYLNFVVSILVASFLATASWFLVEKPALSLKSRLRERWARGRASAALSRSSTSHVTDSGASG